MNTEIPGVIITYGLTILLAVPLGVYIANVFWSKKSAMGFMAPVERAIYRFCGVDADQPMNWKQFLKAMLTINLLWLGYAFVMLLFQDKLPLNPDGNAGMPADLSFNTAISFLVNCNLQHYSGETGV